MTDVVRMTVTGTPVKYAALYVAEDLGFLADEDLEVRADIDAGPGGSWLVENLIEEKADIAVGGIWMPLMYRQNGVADIRPFATLCHANSLLLLGRAPSAGHFQWSNILGRRVLLPQGATAQWMFVEGVLREQNIGASETRIIRDLNSRTTTALWRAGYGDFYLIDSFEAEGLIDEGAVLLGEMADIGGPVPWSVVYATAETCRRADAIVPRLLRSFNRANDWLHSNGPAAVTRCLAPRFPQATDSHLMRVVPRLKQSGVWQQNLLLSVPAADRFQQMMVAYGLFDQPADFGDVFGADPGSTSLAH